MNLMPVIPLAKSEQRPWEWELNAESLNQYSLLPLVWSLGILKERVTKSCFQHLTLTLSMVTLPITYTTVRERRVQQAKSEPDTDTSLVQGALLHQEQGALCEAAHSD